MGSGEGGGEGGPSDAGGNHYNSSSRLGSGAANGAVTNYMEAVRLMPLCRSSPSVFVSCGDTRSSPARHRYRHASTQTDQPINVPVAVLEAFVLAHRPRVLQLLGIQEVVEEPSSPSGAHGCIPLGSSVAPASGVSSPPASGAVRKCSIIAGSSNSNSSSRSLESTGADEESLATEDPEELHTVSAQNPSITIQSTTPVGDTRNNNNNKTSNTQIETYQLTNIQNWNPNPQFQRTAISGSRSIGSLKDILSSSSSSSRPKSQAHQFNIQENDGSATQIHCHSDHSDPNNPLVHYGCASDCPSKDLMYFSEINHAMTRSTSMPVASFRYSPYPSSASLSSKPPFKREADATEKGAAIADTVLLPNTTVETRSNSKKPSYVTDF